MRLIDVDEVLRKMQQVLDEKQDQRDSVAYFAFSSVMSALQTEPTVDAVEVVRCKECKHYGWEQEPCHGKTWRFCRLHKGLVVVNRDTFCSYGERRTDDAVD